MATVKVKWGRRAVYRVEPVRLRHKLRMQITKAVGQQPAAFFRALEQLTGEFKVECARAQDAPEVAHVKAALDWLGTRLAELQGALAFSDGLDYRTRQAIVLHGNEPNALKNAFDAVWKLGSAVELTKQELAKESTKVGNRRSPKTQFAIDLHAYLRRCNIDARGKAFETCLELLLSAVDEGTGEANIHRLATQARKVLTRSSR